MVNNKGSPQAALQGTKAGGAGAPRGEGGLWHSFSAPPACGCSLEAGGLLGGKDRDFWRWDGSGGWDCSEIFVYLQLKTITYETDTVYYFLYSTYFFGLRS